MGLLLAGACASDEEDVGTGSPCQVILQDLWIASDLEADALPRCFVVPEHTVYVMGVETKSLDMLGGLRQVRNLHIEGAPGLRTTAGLRGLRVTGELVIADNPALEDLVGVEATELIESVTLRNNPSLRLASGLQNVKGIESELRVEGPASLDRLPFERLEELGGLVVRDTIGLGVLNLGSLRLVGASELSGNLDLARVELLHLSSVEGDLIIEGHPRLTAIETTAVLERIAGCLIVEDNPALSARDLEPLIAAADCVTRDSPRSRWRGR